MVWFLTASAVLPPSVGMPPPGSAPSTAYGQPGGGPPAYGQQGGLPAGGTPYGQPPSYSAPGGLPSTYPGYVFI